MQLFSTEQKRLEINVNSVQGSKFGCPDRFSDHIVVLPFNFYGEMKMATLATLKFTDAKKPKAPSPALSRRHKLSAKLADQVSIARAQAEGRSFEITRSKRIRDEEGNINTVSVPKRTKPWWFTADSGGLCVSVYYGSRVLELAKGKTAVEANDLAEVAEILGLFKAEVDKGSFDAAIELASGNLRKNFKKRTA